MDMPMPGSVAGSQYQYMQDLRALEATASRQGRQCFIPRTPLVWHAWQQALDSHPDKEFVAYILTGIRYGADRSKVIRSSKEGNLTSVWQYPPLVHEHVAAERAAGRLLGPLPSTLAGACQISPISLIPKLLQLGKWRLIVSPHGGGVNDAISVDHCHMHYASMLNAAAIVRQLGRGTLLALHQAYRLIPGAC